MVSQVTQQADNIGLGANGSLNVKNQVFIGGGNTGANSQVQIDLSGAINQVDANGLGLANTSVLGGGTELAGNTVRLDNPGALFLSAGATQTFTFNLNNGGAATTVTATVTGTAGGINQSQVLTQLNSQLSPYGISAAVGSDGQINFGGTTAFTVSTATADGVDQLATNATTAVNNGVYSVAGAAVYAGKAETLTFQNAQGTATVNLLVADTLNSALGKINALTAPLGIYAVENAAGTGISIQSANNFSASTNTAAGTFTLTGAQATTAPTASSTATGNALAAITAITAAISQLGNVQSRVGAGQNVLNYAISLANSQITNFSAAESGIKDANIAAEAANLTKAQVIQQASVAALAQANSAPQSLLKLLQ